VTDETGPVVPADPGSTTEDVSDAGRLEGGANPEGGIRPKGAASPGGDIFEMSGDFRGAVINIKSTIIGAAEVRDLESMPPEPGDPPYQGLQYFGESDADRFFGRESLVARLVNRLATARFLAVIGASGSGKSSLVRAGVLPALRRGERLPDGSLPPTDSAQWDIRILTPGAHPLEALAVCLAHEAEHSARSLSALASLQSDLTQQPRALSLAARRLLAHNGKKHLLLVIDQFEEIFTQCRQPSERQAFLGALLDTLHPETLAPVTILITLRADYYAHLAEYAPLRQAISQNQEFIGAMTRTDLARAIFSPAALGNWKVQEGLVELILDDLGGEPGALPLLSHALLETWKRRRGRVMTLSGYAAAGGVRGAIAQTAETVFRQRLTPEQQPVARMIFTHLAELGVAQDASPDTRRRTILAGSHDKTSLGPPRSGPSPASRVRPKAFPAFRLDGDRARWEIGQGLKNSARRREPRPCPPDRWFCQPRSPIAAARRAVCPPIPRFRSGRRRLGPTRRHGPGDGGAPRLRALPARA